MKIDVVGTGCLWFSRNNTSFVIDDKILFDISCGNYKQIIKRHNIFDIDTIFITHWHNDHIGDLKVVTTLFIRNKDKLEKGKKLKVYSTPGLAEYLIEYNKLTFSRDDEIDINVLLSVVEFIDVYDGMEFTESGYKVKAYAVEHKMPCFGYTFTDKNGKTIAFSGDTTYCENVEKMLEKSDFALVDMAATYENPVHIDTNTFVKLQNKYTNCKMFPVHTSDPAQEFAIQNGLNYLNDGDILEL